MEKFLQNEMQPCQHCVAEFLRIPPNINEPHQTVITELFGTGAKIHLEEIGWK